MAGLLKQAGYKIILDEAQKDDATCWLLNSCTVKGPSEQHFCNEINAALKRKKSCILAGCVPQSSGPAYLKKFEVPQGVALSIVGVEQIDRVVEIVNETMSGNSVTFLKKPKQKKDRPMLDMPKVRRNDLIEIISINSGCLNACTYCKTKHARGDLSSYPVEEIVERARHAFLVDGVRELWITSEDTGAYGIDIGTDLPTLLRQICAVIPDGCMMRIGMTNPPYIQEHVEAMCEILQHPRVYAFMHVPVQSGSDSVLYSMKREYTNDDFCMLVDKLRAGVPDVSIATDIIAGYPSETDEDWVDTMELCKKYDFPSLFMNQFFPRPGTVAAKMTQIDRRIIKQRTKELGEYFKSYTTYDKHVGEIQEVLITETAFDKKSLVGHNKLYHQVLISPECQANFDRPLIGRRVQVKITEALKHSLKAVVLRDISPASWDSNLTKDTRTAEPMPETTNHEPVEGSSPEEAGAGDAGCQNTCTDCVCSSKSVPDEVIVETVVKRDVGLVDRLWTSDVGFTVVATGCVLASLYVFQRFASRR